MEFKLISFALCPYVQRANIVLLEKGIEHETIYIDLENKPEWFLKISPRGLVPVLVVGDVPIFESYAICEYLDETNPPPRLMPEDPVLRARDRGWFQFAEDILTPLVRRMYAQNEQEYEKQGAALAQSFERLGEHMHGRQFLSGDGSRFGMADVAVAPALTRIELLRGIDGTDIPESLPEVRAWRDRVLARPTVARSVVPDLAERVRKRLAKKGAYVVSAHG